MSGLLWSAMGQGLAGAGSALSKLMERDIDREDRQEERRREREEDAKRRADEREETRRWQEQQNALYRRTADQQAAGRSGGGGDAGLSAKDIAEGGGDEGMIARAAGMTVPELRALRKWSETGDASPFMRDVAKDVDVPDPNNPDYGSSRETRIVKELPPGFEREARAKAQTLAKIEESYRLGKNYKEVAEGRNVQQGVDFANVAATEPAKAGVLAQARRVGGGKELVDVKDNTAFNVSTGANQPTAVGQSMINENAAQAGKYSADAKKVISEATGALQKGATQEKLATMLKSLEKLAESTDLDDAGRKRVQELQMAIVDAMKKNVDTRGAGAAPAAGSAPTAANNGPFQVGATRTVASGPNKGKTVRWDGKGWALVN